MIEIYGRTDPRCEYCEKAKALVQEHGLTHRFYDLTSGEITIEEFKHKFPGRKTVPQVVVNGELLDDGYTSLAAIIASLNTGFGDDFK